MKVLKGTLIGVQVRGLLMSRMLMAFCMFAFASVFELITVVFREIPAFFREGISPAPALYFLVCLIGITSLFYFLAREDYYYYELTDRSITVKNLMKKYELNIDIGDIHSVQFDHSPYSGSNVIIKVNQGTGIKTQSFGTCGFSKEEFLEFKSELEAHQITCKDPSGYFFKIN